MDPEGMLRYLRHVMPRAEGLRVENLHQILGGASRETWSVDAVYSEEGQERRRGLIFRCDPEASVLPSGREVEYLVYRTLEAHTSLPTPRALWIEESKDWLGMTFFVMDRIDGCESSFFHFYSEPYASQLPKIGRAFYAMGGDLTRFDWRGTQLERLLPAPAANECWLVELDRWEAVLDHDAYEALPGTRAALAWLRRNPPPPAQRVCLLSGDYRAGNFLYNAVGEIKGWLDWEMAMIGDPMEDLAWALGQRWPALIPRDEATAVWEERSGLKFDPEAFRWWQLLGALKLLIIFQTGGRSFSSGAGTNLMLANFVLRSSPAQERYVMDLMGWPKDAD